MLARCCPFVLFLQASLLYVSGFLGARLCSKCNSKYVWLSVFLFVCLLVCLLLFAHLRGPCSLQQGFCLCVICGSCVGKSVQHVFAFVPVCLCVCVCVWLFVYVNSQRHMHVFVRLLPIWCVCVCACVILPRCCPFALFLQASLLYAAWILGACLCSRFNLNMCGYVCLHVFVCLSVCYCLPISEANALFNKNLAYWSFVWVRSKKNDCVCLCVSVLLLLYIIFTSCCPAVLCVYVCWNAIINIFARKYLDVVLCSGLLLSGSVCVCLCVFVCVDIHLHL